MLVLPIHQPCRRAHELAEFCLSFHLRADQLAQSLAEGGRLVNPPTTRLCLDTAQPLNFCFTAGPRMSDLRNLSGDRLASGGAVRLLCVKSSGIFDSQAAQCLQPLVVVANH